MDRPRVGFCFIAQGKIEDGDERPIKEGRTYELVYPIRKGKNFYDKPVFSKSGLHASRNIVDALYFAESFWLSQVAVWGNVSESPDGRSFCGESKKVFWCQLVEYEIKSALLSCARDYVCVLYPHLEEAIEEIYQANLRRLKNPRDVQDFDGELALLSRTMNTDYLHGTARYLSVYWSLLDGQLKADPIYVTQIQQVKDYIDNLVLMSVLSRRCVALADSPLENPFIRETYV